MKNLFYLFLFIVCLMADGCSSKDDILEPVLIRENAALVEPNVQYTMPAEWSLHEGTWLQWPHQFTYGVTYRNRLEPTWVAMVKALVSGEKVHIIAYNTAHKNRIISQLNVEAVPLTNVNFKIFQTNDCWVRDNGPIFTRNSSNELRIEDWGFNGWGNKAPYTKDNIIPNSVGVAISLPVVNLNSTMKLEGGAFEIDGAGVFLATKSAILNSNRNPGMTQAQAETALNTNLGATKFIWLNGVAGLETTDMHIDGFARFANAATIVTMNNADLTYWEVPQGDITTLYAATNANNVPYTFVNLPLTQNNVVTTYGKNLGYKGSYVNFYEGNTKVLMPTYNDPNDSVALGILQALYPSKTVVGIDVRNLYREGGMVHCVTQQQLAQ